MPRSGSRSKKTRAKTRLASQAGSTSSQQQAGGNPFAALAPPDQGGQQQADEEEPDEADEEQQSATSNAAGANVDDSGNDEVSPSAVGAATATASSLAEDLLAAPSSLPAGDPVRLETAAYLRRCMLDGTTPPAWVLEMALPGSTRPVGGATQSQIGELITSMANIEKAIVSKLTAVRGRGKTVTFDVGSHSPSEKRGRSASTDNPRARKGKVASGNECDYPMCRHRGSHSRPECRLAKAHAEKGWVVTKTDG